MASAQIQIHPHFANFIHLINIHIFLLLTYTGPEGDYDEYEGAEDYGDGAQDYAGNCQNNVHFEHVVM